MFTCPCSEHLVGEVDFLGKYFILKLRCQIIFYYP